MRNQQLNQKDGGSENFLRINPEENFIEIDGVKYSRQFFWGMANPDENSLYRITRSNDVITLERIETAKAKLSDPVHKYARDLSLRSPS